MRVLGMRPVLPAFAGFVPDAFVARHPHVRIGVPPVSSGKHALTVTLELTSFLSCNAMTIIFMVIALQICISS